MPEDPQLCAWPNMHLFSEIFGEYPDWDGQ